MRFGIGGGGRIARGGFSFGRGGVRGGVGVGPFSLSGGSLGGGGGGEVIASLLAICIFFLTFLLAVLFTFVLLPVLATCALTVLVTVKRDSDSLSKREEKLRLNRNGYFVLDLIPVVVGLFAFGHWRTGVSTLDECQDFQDCAQQQIKNKENQSSFIIYASLMFALFVSAFPLLISRVSKPELWSYPSNTVGASIKGVWVSTRNSPKYAREKIQTAINKIKRWADEE